MGSGGPKKKQPDTEARRPRHDAGHMISIASILVGVVAFSSWAAAGCQRQPPTSDEPGTTGASVLLIGVDGATWSLIHPWILRGLLPNFERLRREGAWGILTSEEPTYSPRIWTTIATGRDPEDHGILGFEKEGPDGQPIAYTNNDRRVRAIWNILAERDRGSTVVGWFTSWPVDKIPGAFISDRSEGPLLAGQYPPLLEPMLIRTRDAVSEEIVNDIQRFLGPGVDYSSVDVERRRVYSNIEKDLEYYYRVDRLRLEWTLELMRDGPTEFTAVFFKGVDAMSHLVWIYMDPESFLPKTRPSAEGQERFRRVIQHYYEFIDDSIGRLLDAAPVTSDVIVVSDHGFRPGRGREATPAYHLNPVLARLGLLEVDQAGRPDPDRSVLIDTTPHWQESNVNRSLWVNQSELESRLGGQRTSRVLPDLVRQLGALETLEGDALFESLKVSGSCSNPSRDCYLFARVNRQLETRHVADNATVIGAYSVEGDSFPLSDLISVRFERSGAHDLKGVLLMAGPRVHRGVDLRSASIYDVAPTILRLLSLPAGRDMPGRVLHAALRTETLPPELPRIATFENAKPIPRVETDDAPDEDLENELRDRLRALGYVQ